MFGLTDLKRIRSDYEEAFGGYCDLSKFELKFSDRDLDLTNMVFKAERENRIFQIAAEPDTVPAAFLKKTGVDYTDVLLQIMVSPSDLKIGACADLFEKWIVNRDPEDIVQNLANDF